MEPPSYAIGVDLGGTRIKAVAVDGAGRVLDRAVRSTRDAAQWAPTIRAIAASFEQGLGGPPSAFGLAAPGLAASDARSIATMPGRLEGLEGLDWTEALATRVPVTVLNDAHAALVAEAWIGAATGARHVLLYTLGTGVGGAILSDGRLLRGRLGRAGHLGHVAVERKGPPGITGLPGSLEEAIGECSLERRSGGKFRTSETLLAAVREGDTAAADLWLASVQSLAFAIASAINVLDPELVVIGGGVAAGAGPQLFAPLEDLLERIEWRPGGVGVKIVPAALGELAGALGAARYARTEAES